MYQTRTRSSEVHSSKVDQRRSSTRAGSKSGPPSEVGSTKNAPHGRHDSTLLKIQKMEQARIDRRIRADNARIQRSAEEKRNIANGNPGNIDFQRLIYSFRESRTGTAQPHTADGLKICVAVRKRPVNSKEIQKKDHDSVSIFNPKITVHNCKTRVDGITKQLDSTDFQFDHTFDECDSTADLYEYTARPLIPFVLEGGRATVFAYGQTGSGKTYTMVGIQQLSTHDLFNMLEDHPQYSSSIQVFVSFFEIYGGRCQDLLNDRTRVEVREDGKGDVHIVGGIELHASNPEELQHYIDVGNGNRTTHTTEANDTSSRSHAICQIALRDVDTNYLHGKLSLIDLAGSERGADTKLHNRQRRMEGAEINKSLLALKECIRNLEKGGPHVPYRASKLTLILKDSFTRQAARTVMIATVSPGSSHSDHTLNTLRYADRVKNTKVVNYTPQTSIPKTPSQQETSEDEDEDEDAYEEQVIDEEESVSGISSPDYGDDPMTKEGPVLDFTSDDMNLDDKYKKEMLNELYEEESKLLGLHMCVVKENAEMLVEEGDLLQQVQGSEVGDYDMERYVTRIEQIIDQKMQMLQVLKDSVNDYRAHLDIDERYLNKRLN